MIFKGDKVRPWYYMGQQMVYILVDGKEMGFYSEALDKKGGYVT